MSDIKLAKVIKTYPEAYRVDVLMLDDGTEISNIQVMASLATNRTGITDLPELERSGEKDLLFSQDKDAIAVLAYFALMPVVIGFLHPTTTQMLFKEKDRMVYRQKYRVRSCNHAFTLNTAIWMPFFPSAIRYV